MSPATVLILVYSGVFASVLLAIEAGYLYWRDVRGASRRVNRRLELIDKGIDRADVLLLLKSEKTQFTAYGPFGPLLQRLSIFLTQAGVRVSLQQFLVFATGLTLLALIVAMLLTARFGGATFVNRLLLCSLFAAALGFGLPLIYLSSRRTSRMNKVQAQFPVALDVFVRGLRAGHPVNSALGLLTEEMADPLGTEFGIVVDETLYGLDLRSALENMANRLQQEDIHMFVVCLSIQAETGGNLAEILEKLSSVIRDRASMKMKVIALSGEGRMTAKVLSVLPILTFIFMFTKSPGFYLDVADEPAFMPSALGIVMLYFLGLWIIRRMVSIKV